MFSKVTLFKSVVTCSQKKLLCSFNPQIRLLCSLVPSTNEKIPKNALRIKRHSPKEAQLSGTKVAEIVTANDDAPVSSAFNLAAYVKQSPNLQELIKMGVNLHSIEKRKGLGQFVLNLDFERDVKSHLIFLHDLGIPAESFGDFITKNPLIFKESIDDLTVRVNYLEHKKFQPSQIINIIQTNPFWLMFPTKRIDRRLGFFQTTFELTGAEVRQLAVTNPKLITYNMEHIRLNTFTIKEEMGFEKEEVKSLLLQRPKLWMLAQSSLHERIDYVHNVMKIPHEQIVLQPSIILHRKYRIKQRHEFLQAIGKDQYDCKKPLYVSLDDLVGGTDLEFVINVAKSTVATYDAFLRTL